MLNNALGLFSATTNKQTKKRLNSLLRRAGKLILPEKSLTTDEKLNKIGILSLHKQLDYNKGVFMHMALTNNAPVYISSLHKAPHSSSRNNYLQLPKSRVDLFKASRAFSGALFWKSSSAPQIMSLTQLLQAKSP